MYVDGIYLHHNWSGEFENVDILVTITVNEDEYRVGQQETHDPEHVETAVEDASIAG